MPGPKINWNTKEYLVSRCFGSIHECKPPFVNKHFQKNNVMKKKIGISCDSFPSLHCSPAKLCTYTGIAISRTFSFILRHHSFLSILHTLPCFAITSNDLFLPIFKRPSNPTAPPANTRSLQMHSSDSEFVIALTFDWDPGFPKASSHSPIRTTDCSLDVLRLHASKANIWQCLGNCTSP